MSFYLDTSCCVAALTPESGSQPISTWLGAHRDEILTSSLWVHAEVASALSIKVRTASLTTGQRGTVMAAWLSFREGLRNLGIAQEMFVTAAEIAGRHDLTLRAGDALHLAVAAAHGCTLVTLDERMAKAAVELGVPVAAI